MSKSQEDQREQAHHQAQEVSRLTWLHMCEKLTVRCYACGRQHFAPCHLSWHITDFADFAGGCPPTASVRSASRPCTRCGSTSWRHPRTQSGLLLPSSLCTHHAAAAIVVTCWLLKRPACFCNAGGQVLPGVRLPEGHLRDVRQEDPGHQELQAERLMRESCCNVMTRGG